MKRILSALILILMFLPAAASLMAAGAGGDVILRISGGYLAYSYDHGQVYGERVAFRLGDYEVISHGIKIDVGARDVLAYGAVELKKGDIIFAADELIFKLPAKGGILLRYGDAIEMLPLDSGAAITEESWGDLATRRKPLDELTLVRLKSSLVYFAAKTIEISDSFAVTGYDITLFIEGIESIRFAKFNMSSGNEQKTNGFSLDKVWYTKTQGLFGAASFTIAKENKINSFTQVYYEEHSFLKDYVGLPRQFDLQSATSMAIGGGSQIGLAVNYNSTSLWNTHLWIDRSWKSEKDKVLFDFTYNKPLEGRAETWLGVQANIDLDSAGRLAVQGKYEVHNQALATLAYNAVVLKRLSLALQSTYSRVLIGGTGSISQIFTSDANLSYRADLFSLGTDYYLNYDLFGNQRLSRPQLRLAFNPITFYDGLLTATLQNVFLVNEFTGSSVSTSSYNDNTALTLAAAPIYFNETTSFQTSLACEQFLEKQGRNFTSGGLILRGNSQIFSGVTLEGFYSVQSRRKSKGWLIEGTTSQDLSGVLRLNPAERLNGWLSVSFDPKTGEWKQAIANATVGLIKNWNFQSLLNYDFYRKVIVNVDLYLIRHAGRFDLRFVWRSISKQFMIELIPAV